MVFFLDADGKVYARYGGRDSHDADNRQSLDGLHYTMNSVLEMHARAKKEHAARTNEAVKTVRDLSSGTRRGCTHCHQIKEAISTGERRSGKWDRESVWRYPLPENLGLTLEVDRGNIVKSVAGKSSASVAGLQPGDVVQRLNGVPIHSFGDAQFALDRAPATGSINVSWKRGEKTLQENLTLTAGWRKTDLSWRASFRHIAGSARVDGDDLTAEEKKALGLSAKQLAFRQKMSVNGQARAAGIRAGDIILGVDDKPLEMDSSEFNRYIRNNYFVGDKVTVNLLREGKRMSLSMPLLR